MVIWSLFDGSGLMCEPWVKAGHTAYCFNSDNADHGAYREVRVIHDKLHYVDVWIDEYFLSRVSGMGIPKPDIIFSFPPCTDIAVSGAAHFAKKLEEDPLCQQKAVDCCKVAAAIGEFLQVPYVIENPVSVLSSLWRKPDHTFNPSDYGGYLPEDDKHPLFPDLIKPRDAYPKKTCLWSGRGFVMPDRKPVEVEEGYSSQHSRLGGKSQKTKTIRSLTPRGFALSVFEANAVH